MSPQDDFRIAVLVPCYNEASAIEKVVRDFRTALPQAAIYVYDNGSTDGSAEIAAAAGAEVRREPRRGKGNVVRRMFQDVDADAYVMVDGDDTYDAPSAPVLVERLVRDDLDMVVGRRVASHRDAYRTGHRSGNALLTGLVRRLFDAGVEDMLSGYRVFSRRFAKSFPSFSREFEVETELTVHAMQMRMPVAEIDTPYKERPQGSASKLRTVRDGGRILLTIMNLVRNERPLLFFSIVALVFGAAALALGVPAAREALSTGAAPPISAAILCTGLVLVAGLCVATGLVLDLVSHVRREVNRLAYLQYPPPSAPRRAPSRHAPG